MNIKKEMVKGLLGALLFVAAFLPALAFGQESSGVEIFPFNRLKALDAGAFYDFRSKTLYGGASTPMLVFFGGAMESDIGFLANGDKVIPSAGLSLNIKRLADTIPQRIVDYRLDEQLIIGGFGAYDFKADEWLAGLKAAWRFGSTDTD